MYSVLDTKITNANWSKQVKISNFISKYLNLNNFERISAAYLTEEMRGPVEIDEPEEREVREKRGFGDRNALEIAVAIVDI